MYSYGTCPLNVGSFIKCCMSTQVTNVHCFLFIPAPFPPQLLIPPYLTSNFSRNSITFRQPPPHPLTLLLLFGNPPVSDNICFNSCIVNIDTLQYFCIPGLGKDVFSSNSTKNSNQLYTEEGESEEIKSKPANSNGEAADEEIEPSCSPKLKKKSELSAEACAVVDSFPDLSFLSARKLMFTANENMNRWRIRP